MSASGATASSRVLRQKYKLERNARGPGSKLVEHRVEHALTWICTLPHPLRASAVRVNFGSTPRGVLNKDWKNPRRKNHARGAHFVARRAGGAQK